MVARLARARFERLGRTAMALLRHAIKMSSTISELSSRVIAPNTSSNASDARSAPRLDGVNSNLTGCPVFFCRTVARSTV